MKPIVRAAPPVEPPQPPPGPERFLKRTVEFDLKGARAQGVVIAARDNGVRGKGAIPDFILTVRGKSGRVMEVSIYDTYASILD
jgi:hypothetical protein